MITLYVILAVFAGIVLFLAGFYTGIWIQRHSREVIEREVEKIVPTEKVAFVEVPKVVQVPVVQREAGGMAVIGQDRGKQIFSKEEMEANRRMAELSNDPEL